MFTYLLHLLFLNLFVRCSVSSVGHQCFAPPRAYLKATTATAIQSSKPIDPKDLTLFHLFSSVPVYSVRSAPFRVVCTLRGSLESPQRPQWCSSHGSCSIDGRNTCHPHSATPKQTLLSRPPPGAGTVGQSRLGLSRLALRGGLFVLGL